MSAILNKETKKAIRDGIERVDVYVNTKVPFVEFYVNETNPIVSGTTKIFIIRAYEDSIKYTNVSVDSEDIIPMRRVLKKYPEIATWTEAESIMLQNEQEAVDFIKNIYDDKCSFVNVKKEKTKAAMIRDKIILSLLLIWAFGFVASVIIIAFLMLHVFSVLVLIFAVLMTRRKNNKEDKKLIGKYEKM